MAKPFDAATKHLLEHHPASWLTLIGHGAGLPIRVVNAELSIVTAEADKALLVEGPEPWLAHFEIQASHDLTLPRRLFRYNAMLDVRHDLPVLSVAVLLRPEADSPVLSGIYERCPPVPGSSVRFEYQVVRIWRQPVETILAGGLGILPLAPLTGLADEAIPDVLRRMGERFRAEAPPREAAELWAATEVLLGLYRPPASARQMVRGVAAMFMGIRGIEESTVYQAILAEGRAEGEARGRAEGEARGRAEGEARGRAEGEARGRAEQARRYLLKFGALRLGTPGEEVRAAIEAMTDADEIDHLVDRLSEVSDWGELLMSP